MPDLFEFIQLSPPFFLGCSIGINGIGDRHGRLSRPSPHNPRTIVDIDLLRLRSSLVEE
jgi:hypothetical protein